MNAQGPIGIFDSGLGGLVMTKAFRPRCRNTTSCIWATPARSVRTALGECDFAIHDATVDYLFDKGCPLVIIAC
ncbi:MAG: hypothetical protein IPN95_19320 [Bacteroidetes bacterium]|nr:hypothetical protein [Bacteroidota bacterium]